MDKNQILDHLDKIAESSKNVKNSPSFRVAVLLRDSLVLKGMDFDLAEEVVLRIQLDISQEYVKDEAFISVFVDKLATILFNLQQSVLKCFSNKLAYIKSLETIKLKVG